jgi:hypothetical protein
MPSKRFEEMEKRLGELRSSFLPDAWDPTGTYTPRVVDLTRAYRLLSHAEIEAYLEDVALAAVVRACEAWDVTRTVSECLLSLLAYFGAAPITAKEIAKAKPGRQLVDVVESAKKDYSHYVREENHGIRALNVRRLLFAAGVREHDLSSTWLNTIDSFGAQRGETDLKVDELLLASAS